MTELKQTMKLAQQPFLNNFFRDLQIEIQRTILDNKVYAKLCQDHEFSPKTELTLDELESIPYLTTSDFKLSTNTYKELVRTEDIDTWTVSSGTSEDQSIVGRTKEDINLMYGLWRTQFKEFFFYDTVSTVLIFRLDRDL